MQGPVGRDRPADPGFYALWVHTRGGAAKGPPLGQISLVGQAGPAETATWGASMGPLSGSPLLDWCATVPLQYGQAPRGKAGMRQSDAVIIDTAVRILMLSYQSEFLRHVPRCHLSPIRASRAAAPTAAHASAVTVTQQR